MMAAAMGHTAIVEALLNGGAHVNATHTFGLSTALHFAAEMGHAPVIRALCTARADVNATKSNGGMPIHTAADSDQPRALVALLDHMCRSPVDPLLNGDTTPLYLAAQRGATNGDEWGLQMTECEHYTLLPRLGCLESNAEMTSASSAGSSVVSSL